MTARDLSFTLVGNGTSQRLADLDRILDIHNRTAHFVIEGDAPVPQGSKRIGRHGARPVILDDNDHALKLWRARVATEFDAATGAGWVILDEPVEVRAHFYFTGPKANKYGTWKATAPDLDKLVRALLDGLADGGAYVNDGRVVRIFADKHICTEDFPQPGVSVSVGPVRAFDGGTR